MASTSERRPVNLIRGWPAPSLLPSQLLSSSMTKILSDPEASVPALEYGPDAGYLPLRTSISTWLSSHYSSPTPLDPERICITGGASQNLQNVLTSFTDPVATRAVFMVAPCYHLACGIFEDAGFKGRLKAVKEDGEGLDVEELERKIKALEEDEGQKEAKPFKDPGPDRKHYRYIIYVVATSSNPSGKTMPVSRREALVKLARRHNALIVSDDVYDFLQWPIISPSSSSSSSSSQSSRVDLPPELRLPRLSDVDISLGVPSTGYNRFGNAISNASFSKMAGPGVRTGWVDAAPALAHGLSQTAATRSGGAPSQLCAAMMSEMVSSGGLKKFVSEVTRPALQKRHGLMMDAIAKYIQCHEGVTVHGSSLSGMKVYGGYFVWFRLPNDILAKPFADAALKEESVIVGHGGMFEVKGDEASAKFDHEVRLCFSWEDEDAIVDAVKRLGNVLDRMKKNPEKYAAGAGDDSKRTNLYK